MLELDASERDELAGLAQDDDAGRADVTARYAKARRGIETEAELAAARRAGDAAERDEVDAARRRSIAQDKLKTAERDISAIERRIKHLNANRGGDVSEAQYKEEMYGDGGLMDRLPDAHDTRKRLQDEYRTAQTDYEAAGWRRAAAQEKQSGIEAYRPRIDAHENASADRTAAQANDAALRERIKTLEELLQGTTEGYFRSTEQIYQNLLRSGELTTRALDQLIQRTKDLADRNRQTL